MKRLLVIGSGFLQSFVIKKAKDMGYYTISIDKNPNSLGFKFADEYEAIDIIDNKACLEYAKSKKVDGVLTAATDYGVISTAYVAEQMGLPGLKYEIAKIIKNKYMTRHIIASCFDNSIQHFEVCNIDQVKKLIIKLKFPVFIKPCDGSGSKAVSRADNANEVLNACENAMKSSMTGRALIEDFIEGEEYGVESFVYNNKVYVLGVMGKHMTKPPDYAELGHFCPSLLSIEEKVKKVAVDSIKALGINFGAVNMDVLVSKEGRVNIVDVGARMGGNLIYSHIIPLGTGYDYMGNIIKASLGESFDVTPRNAGINIATRLLALRPGRVIGLRDMSEIENRFDVKIYHHIKINDYISEYHNNLDGCGYVVATANELNQAERNAEEAKNMVDIGIERE